MAHDIDLWYIKLDKLFNIKEIKDSLSVFERKRAARLIFQKHRDAFIAARGALRWVLSQYINISPDLISFSVKEHGKPYLKEHKLAFNLSHSGDVALIGVSKEKPIGVDIELFSDRDYLGIASKTFSTGEEAALNCLPSNALKDAFFRIWTQKEAFIKLSGLGLHYPLKDFSVSATEPETLLEVKGQNSLDYCLKCFKLAPDRYAAICVPAPLGNIKFHQFDFNQLLNTFRQNS
jgi:4'-phosphopantetheinyl transferase